MLARHPACGPCAQTCGRASSPSSPASRSESAGDTAVFLRNSYPLAYAFPQGVRLRLLLNLKRGELDASDGIAQCIAGRSHEGQGDWLVSIADGRDLERAMPLIRQAFNAAESRGRT